MTVSEYEIDLEMLENMCSEIEESAFLLNTNLDIVWMNKVLKDRIYNNYSLGELIGYDYKANPTYTKNVCSKLFGEDTFSANSTAKKVFKTGKLAKSMRSFNNIHIKKISIPIRHGPDIIYVLEIVEESPVGIDINHNIAHSGTTSKILYDEMTESKDVVSPTNRDILKYFLEQTKDACILTEKNNTLITTNKMFDDLFKDSQILRNLLFTELQKHQTDDPTKYLNSILNLSHTVSRKPVSYEDKLIGFIYLLKKNVSKKTQRKSEHGLKKSNKKSKK